MSDMFATMAPLERVFVLCALGGGGLFLMRLVLSLFGGDGHDSDGHDAGGGDSHPHAGFSFKLLSIQGLSSFFTMFGLVGYALLTVNKVAGYWAVLGGTVAGTGAVAIISSLLHVMKRLQSSGTLDNANAVGATGTVYLTIPPDGTGKAEVAVQERLRVYDAVSKDKVELKTGERVKVLEVVGGNVLVVQKVV